MQITHPGFKSLFYCLLMILVTSCTGDTLSMEEQFEKDITDIEAFIKARGWTAQKTVDGIYYVIDEPGGSEKPVITSTVTVTYFGKFLDQVPFDAGEKIQFGLSQVIQGWQIGIPKFGRGGKGKLIIPSKYAYGDRSISGFVLVWGFFHVHQILMKKY
jgi:FKBP-type peptidyl-prolyl cis-trans isomerase FkpA